jgi:hypothetical protein
MLVGIIGKTNTGKSTFFKAETLAEVEIEGRPFVTIKANEGCGFVKVKCVDADFNVQCKPKHGYCLDGWRFVPVKLLDVAGLVPGAHKGHGLGLRFLDDLRQADVLIHVIDVAGSTNENGEPVQPGSYDPAEDIRFLEIELDKWYLDLIRKGWERFARETKQERPELLHKAVARHLSGLGVTEKLMENVIKELNLNEDIMLWDEAVLEKLSTTLRKATKPMIIACNKIDMPNAAENFAKLKKEFPRHMLVPCSAESELALREAAKHNLIRYVAGENHFEVIDGTKLSDKQKNALDFIQKKVLDKFGSTGVEQVLDDAVYKLLRYIAVYPVATNKLTDKDGNVLPDCFLVPENTTALEFAFKIHTDLGNSFIRAVDMKTKQIIGKDHPLKHRDVIEIVTDK